MEKACVIVHIQDARAPDDELDSGITRRLPARVPVLTVLNKIDLLDPDAAGQTHVSRGALKASRDAPQTSAAMPGGAEAGVSLGISAKTGAGLDSLRWKLLEIAGWNPGAESPWLARERNLRALADARGHFIFADRQASESQTGL